MMGRLNHDQGQLFYSFCLEAYGAVAGLNKMVTLVTRQQPIRAGAGSVSVRDHFWGDNG
jgi:hypothetical protein